MAPEKVVKNILTLVSGNFGIQVVGLLFMPWITRLYEPSVYGQLGTYMALVAAFSSVFSLGYHNAILLPKKDSQALVLLMLSIYISLFCSLLLSVYLFFWGDYFQRQFHLSDVVGLSFVLPVSVLSVSLVQAFSQWQVRLGEYKKISFLGFLNAAFVNSSRVVAGYFYPMASSLTITHAVCFVAYALIAGLSSRENFIGACVFSFKRMKCGAFRYSSFPLFQAPQAFLNALSQSIPVMVLAILFGPSAAGCYALARTVLVLPAFLVGKAAQDVLYARIVYLNGQGEPIKKEVRKYTLMLASLGVIPFGLIFLGGGELFAFVFGDGWGKAGDYAQWLSIWSFFAFINRPSVSAIPVLGVQRQYLFYEISSLLLRMLALYVGYSVFNQEVLSVIYFSLVGMVMNILLIIYVDVHSGRIERAGAV